MSNFIPDAQEMERQWENRLNRVVRHCRIVNVKEKPKRVSLNPRGFLPYPSLVPQPQIPGLFSLPPMHPSCAGCIGKVCGNVACPSRLTVTCSPYSATTPAA